MVEKLIAGLRIEKISSRSDLSDNSLRELKKVIQVSGEKTKKFTEIAEFVEQRSTEKY